MPSNFDKARFVAEAKAYETEQNAARWVWIRDNLARATSPHMDGKRYWSFRSDLRGEYHSITEAVDAAMLSARLQEMANES